MRQSLALGVLLCAVVAGTAGQGLDRKKMPVPGPSPALHVPASTRSALADGAGLIVAEKHDLPLISFSITFQGGANQFEAPGREGVAALTAALLSEGTTKHDGEALSNALQLLGTSINAAVAGETGVISCVSTAAKFPATLNLLAEMLQTPTFPAAGLDRLRGQRLVALTQARTQPGAIAARVFPRILYGGDHPYGRLVTEASLKAITRDDVVAFHKTYFQPGRALITVVGDTTAAVVTPLIQSALAGWPRGGTPPAFRFPPVGNLRATTIFLVDKPGAAQSTFAIGRPGPPRSTPDYFALQVMNTMLGGMFQSRLNANIREEKGYSYGVGSNFAYGKGPGAFRAGGDIVSAKSDAALVEFMRELRGMAGSRPITDDELATAKDALVQGLPATFASVASINNALTALWTQGLPDDYYQSYARQIAAVTKADVVRVATQYVTADKLAIVIVGDKSAIEGPLKATGIGPIVIYDIDGNPVGSPR